MADGEGGETPPPAELPAKQLPLKNSNLPRDSSLGPVCDVFAGGIGASEESLGKPLAKNDQNYRYFSELLCPELGYKPLITNPS